MARSNRSKTTGRADSGAGAGSISTSASSNKAPEAIRQRAATYLDALSEVCDEHDADRNALERQLDALKGALAQARAHHSHSNVAVSMQAAQSPRTAADTLARSIRLDAARRALNDPSATKSKIALWAMGEAMRRGGTPEVVPPIILGGFDFASTVAVESVVFERNAIAELLQNGRVDEAPRCNESLRTEIDETAKKFEIKVLDAHSENARGPLSLDEAANRVHAELSQRYDACLEKYSRSPLNVESCHSPESQTLSLASQGLAIYVELFKVGSIKRALDLREDSRQLRLAQTITDGSPIDEDALNRQRSKLDQWIERYNVVTSAGRVHIEDPQTFNENLRRIGIQMKRSTPPALWRLLTAAEIVAPQRAEGGWRSPSLNNLRPLVEAAAQMSSHVREGTSRS